MVPEGRKKIAFLQACLSMAMLCTFAHAKRSSIKDELFYIGSKGSGRDQGIVAATLDPRTGKLSSRGLAAQAERPTWLAIYAPASALYAVSEIGNDGAVEGKVSSYRIDRATGGLAPINTVGSGGGGATHLALDAKLGTLFVANYGGGTIAALTVRADGGLKAPSSVQVTAGTGPSPRQKSPHPHGVTLDPSGRFLLAPDLGADRIFIYRVDTKTHALSPAQPPYAPAPAGAGPRHLVFSPDGRTAFVNTELDAVIRSYAWNAQTGQLRALAATPTTSPEFPGPKSAGEILLSADGRFLYASHRGENALIVYRTHAGRLTELQRLPSGGKGPGHFAIDPTGRWLVVANEGDNAVNVFAVDARSGKLTSTPEVISTPSPVNIAFVRP
jgi:6-phosphogluconolactonase